MFGAEKATITLNDREKHSIVSILAKNSSSDLEKTAFEKIIALLELDNLTLSEVLEVCKEGLSRTAEKLQKPTSLN